MLNFQVACAQNVAASKYGMLLLICKKLRKNDTLEIPTRDP